MTDTQQTLAACVGRGESVEMTTPAGERVSFRVVRSRRGTFLVVVEAPSDWKQLKIEVKPVLTTQGHRK